MVFGAAFLISLLTISLFSSGNALSLNHYAKTCPDVESIVANAVKSAASSDQTIPATLLRMHFHDCLLRGCDGSILLDSKGHHKAEKDAAPNLSLHGFFVIDNAKRALEAACPGVVSCADILAIAARDAVVLSGGPSWSVPKGRKDGRVSRASDIATMPSPTFNISQLQKSFSLRGLSLDDLVALSEYKSLTEINENVNIVGAHTIGFAHCAAFQNRIHNFNTTHDIDPTLRPTFASKLQGRCPLRNTAKNAGVPMDPYSATFDNNYYKLVLQGTSLFSSDQALLQFPKTKALVYKYASSKKAFWNAFAYSIVKLSSINGGQEIRKNCRIVN